MTRRFYFDSNQKKTECPPTRQGVLLMLAEYPDNYNGFMSLVAEKRDLLNGVKTVIWFRSYHRPSLKRDEIISLATWLQDPFVDTGPDLRNIR